MFDAPPEEKCEKVYAIDFPYDAEPWNVGLIVGPSGSGKSTVLRHVWGDPPALRWDGAGVVDDFPDGMSVEQISSAISSVGFSSPPAWVRPHRVLSVGEQFRVDIARRLVSDQSPIVVDEYTSVVDRQIAKIASHAIQKYVRASDKKFVAVGCHYDVEDWLQPDWVLDMSTQSFRRRLLQRRPAIDIVIGRLPRSAWGLFAPFHYMSAELPSSAHGFGLWADGRLASSLWLAVFQHPKAKDIVRVARAVTLPDFQGIGLNFQLLETLGAALKAAGKRLRNYPAHPAFIRSHQKRSETWKEIREQSFASAKTSGQLSGGADRYTSVFEFCGTPNARFATTLGVVRGLAETRDRFSEAIVASLETPIDNSKIDTFASVPPLALTERTKSDPTTFASIATAPLGDLLDFIPHISPEFMRPVHLAEWAEQLENCLLGGVRACVAVPIRHHKTETTIHGIAWLILRDPTIRIIYMVADHEVANDRANRIRQVVESVAAQLGLGDGKLGPTRGQNVKTSWRNDEGGGVIVMSAKQSKLGQDCDVLICDDPISEFDAYNPVVRQAVDMAIAHYTMRAGRSGRRGSVCILMSRWHPDDPIGRRMGRVAERWTIIHAPAIAQNDNGQDVAFAEHVMPLEELYRRKAEILEVDPTGRLWTAQFQNDPLPDELGLFRDPVLYDDLPEGPYRTVIGCDLSTSSAITADYFAAFAMRVYQEQGIEDGRRIVREVGYVVECMRSRWDLAMSEATLRRLQATHPGAPIFSYMSGPEVGNAYYMAEKGIAIQVMPARYSKRTRAQKTIDKSNAGLIRWPSKAPWLRSVLMRFKLFSGNENAGDDDEIDAAVSACDGGMHGSSGQVKTFGKRRM